MGKIIFLIKTIASIPVRLFSRVSPFALIKGSTIDGTSYIGQWTRLYWAEVGRYSYVGRSCTVNKARIGSFCSIAEDCIIGAPMHPTNHVSTSPVFYSQHNVLRTCFNHDDFEEFQQVFIGNDVWIGAKAFIKGGLTIGNGAIIGAHAVVTKNVDDYAIVAGNPARVIRYRFEPEVRDRISKSEWWNLSDKELQNKAKLFSDPSLF